MGKLTSLAVKSAKPGRHADGDGLYLLVKPPTETQITRGERCGARFWLLRIVFEGRRRDVGLGSADLNGRKVGDADPLDDIPILSRRVLTLAEAREKASILRRAAKAGRDPFAERDKDRASAPTFEKAAEAAHKALAPSWSAAHAKAFLASLKEHAVPVIGAKRVDHIEAADMRDVLAPIWTKSPEMAGKVRQRMATVLNYSSSQKWRSTDAPLGALSFLLGDRPEGGNFPAMPYADVPDYVAKLKSQPETMGRLALLFLIFTTARSGEVRKTRWSHIDEAGKLWNRPAEIMKGRKAKAHSITLNDQALAILKRARELRVDDDGDPLVFPGTKGNAMSDMTISKIMRDAKLPYVPHGFRSSFRDWAAEKMPSIPDAVAEAAIAHVVPDKVVKAYKRTTFLDMRRELLHAWGNYLSNNPVRSKD